MLISYHGHAVVKIETNGKTLIDWSLYYRQWTLADLKVRWGQAGLHPVRPTGMRTISGTQMQLARESNALVIATPEIATYLRLAGSRKLPRHEYWRQLTSLNSERWKWPRHFHSTGFWNRKTTKLFIWECRPACLLTIEGKTIYHAGDTSLFGDMKLIGDRHPIDLAFSPIGDNFTMGPEDAVVCGWTVGGQERLFRSTTIPSLWSSRIRRIVVDMLPEGTGMVLDHRGIPSNFKHGMAVSLKGAIPFGRRPFFSLESTALRLRPCPDLFLSLSAYDREKHVNCKWGGTRWTETSTFFICCCADCCSITLIPHLPLHGGGAGMLSFLWHGWPCSYLLLPGTWRGCFFLRAKTLCEKKLFR